MAKLEKTAHTRPHACCFCTGIWVSNGVIARLCTPTQTKKTLSFAFLLFGFSVSFLFGLFFLFAIHVPASMTGRSLILQALYSAEWVLLVHWTTGHCSTHLVGWKMRITHWTSQGDHLHRGLECLIRMECEDEKKRSTMEKAHLGWAAASCQSHELCD